MRELHDSQHMQMVFGMLAAMWSRQARVVRLQRQPTAHATRLFHSAAAHSSCTREAVSSVHAVKSIWSTGGLVWTLSG